jgi:hypothetical protein
LNLPDVNFVCENSFEGGGWLQVRYINSSPEKWHRAQDGLRGTDVYGYPGLSEYSIYFKNLMKPADELLFSLGMNHKVSEFELCFICRFADRQPSILAHHQLGSSVQQWTCLQ